MPRGPRSWAFNTPARNALEAMPAEFRAALDPEVLRRTLDALTLRLDGKQGSPVVVARRRKDFTAALEHGVVVKALPRNQWLTLSWTPPRSSSGSIDRRRVVNPMQARTPLAAVAEQGRIGPRMVAYHACLYYAALRPEEGVGIVVPRNFELPARDDEWGEFVLDVEEPHAVKAWTDAGTNRDRRQLKQRARHPGGARKTSARIRPGCS